MKFAVNCFSGECGLCRNCCQNISDDLQSENNNLSESIQRATDLESFMGRKYVQEVTDIYNKNLKYLSKFLNENFYHL